MAEDLTPADVEQYTKGRLLASDPNTQRMLDAALDRARRFCGWHVTPVKTETITLPGSGFDFIVLPTLKVVSIDSITEDGATIDQADVEMFTGEPGILYKKRCRRWCGTVEITYSHGYTATEAAAFREAVLQLIDITSLSIGTGASGPLTDIEVDDVHYQWATGADHSYGIAKNPMDESPFYQYRILSI